MRRQAFVSMVTVLGTVMLACFAQDMARADEPDDAARPTTARPAFPPTPGEAIPVGLDELVVDPAPGATATRTPTGRTIAPITITGRLFYNDRRTHGHFGVRVRPDGTPGTQCRRNQSCGPNWLSAKNMVVDAYEIDRRRTPGRGSPCRPQERVASATVDAQGVYRITIDRADPCDEDRLADIAIQLQFRTRFCGAAECYLVRPEGELAYAVSHPSASQTRPRSVKPGRTISVPDAFFNTSANADTANTVSIAANYFAALVDTMDFVHRTNSVPFYRANYSGLSYVYPSTRSGTATAKSPTEVVISDFETSVPDPANPGRTLPAWPAGATVAHEYGHVLMMRAWDGSYGPDLVGKSAGDGGPAEAPSDQRAFKEAWAEFTSQAVFDAQYSCEAASTDDNSAAPSNADFGPASNGTAYRFNVRKMLCDWYDDQADDDPNLTGPGDNFNATDYKSMWYNIRRMYVDRDAYEGKFRDPGLMACDYVNYYRLIRRPENRARIDDLIANNNIRCTEPVPVGRIVLGPEPRTATSPRTPLPPDAPISGN